MKSLVLLVLVSFCATATAQTNVRVRGTITALNGDVLSVKSRDGRAIELNLAPGTQVVTTKATTLMAWDSMPDSLMTNANLTGTAQVRGGSELTLKYKDGEQKILVTPATEYFMQRRPCRQRRQVHDPARCSEQRRRQTAAVSPKASWKRSFRRSPRRCGRIPCRW